MSWNSDECGPGNVLVAAEFRTAFVYSRGPGMERMIGRP